MVRAGMASPYFYQGQRGQYAAQLMQAARNAKKAKRGIWGACAKARLNPTRNFIN
jgi:endonuclease YncB( thermonuclease family)